MIDSHCHLADEIFAPDLTQVIERSKAEGLERVMVILEAGNPQEAAQAATSCGLWPDIRIAIGVLPHHANRFAYNPPDAAVTVREQIARTPNARAVGEIGLD